MTDTMIEPAHSVTSVDEQAMLVRMQRDLLGMSEQEAPPVRVADRYHITRRLGRGATAEVFAAWDELLEREIAIKLLRPTGEGSSVRHEARVRREAKVQAKLSDRHVVQIFDVGVFRDGLFIAMERVEGTSLEQWQAEEPRDWKQLLEVYRRAGEGLVAAHDEGLVHKDFKPGNVLVSSDLSRVCVADFGLARAMSDESAITEDPGGSDGGVHAPTWTIGFTPQYASPEQMRGEPVDARSDQYSFCASLFEALCGQPPFSGRSNAELRAAKESGHVEVPRPRHVPKYVMDAILQGLDPSPDRRFDDMRALLEALELRHPLRWMGVVLALVVAGIIVAWSFIVTDDPCDRYDALLGDHWNDAAREELVRGFATAGRPAAAEATISALESRFDEWQQRVSVACVAPERVEAQADRLRCHERQLLSTAVLLERFTEADSELIDEAGEAIARLPTLDECDRLRGEDPVLQADLRRALDEHLAQAQAAVVADDWETALERATEARTLAQAHQQERAELEAMIVLGRARILAARVDEGVDLLVEAAERAEERRDEALAWRAWLESVAALPLDMTPLPRELDRRLERARAAAGRMGQDEYRTQRIAFERVRVGLDPLDPDSVPRTLEQVWRWTADQDLERPHILDLRRAVATSLTAHLQASKPEAALEYATEALRLAEKQLGGGPTVFQARINLVSVLSELCRTDEARDALASALDQATVLWPEPREEQALAHLLMAQLELREGRLDPARTQVAEARSSLPPGASYLGAELLLAEANVQFAAGDLAAAKRKAQQATAAFEALGSPGAAFSQAVVAECLLYEGEIAQALEVSTTAGRALEESMGDAASAYLAVPRKVEGLALLVMGKEAEAKARLEEAKSGNGPCEVLESADIAAGLAEAHRRDGDLTTAQRLDLEAQTAYAELAELGRSRQQRLGVLLERRSPSVEE